jgi:hypothetical protein
MKRKPAARAADFDKELKELERAMQQQQRENEERRARMTPEEREADDAARAERLARSRASYEAWMEDPPWFVFYEPYQSLIGTNDPKFVDARGNELAFRNPDGATELLGLAVSAKDELLAGTAISRRDWSITYEEWKELLAQLKEMVQRVKEDIPLQKFEFVDRSGKHISTPDLQDLSDFSVVSIVHQWAVTLPRSVGGNKAEAPELEWLRILWCMICLREIDDAVLACLYEDAGDGIGATIRATEALWSARSLASSTSDAPKPSVDARAMGRQRGTEARKKLYASAQKWTRERWDKESAEYENKPSKAAPIYVRLIAQEFQTAAGLALTVTVDTVKAWLKAPSGEE